MRLRVAMLAVAASLAVAGPAAADTYTVTGSADNSIPAGCAPAGAGAWTCTMLRAAVNAANASTTVDDEILITSPTVNLPVGQIDITDNATIAGLGARQTTIDATGAGAPAFRITGNSTVTLANMTVRRGTNANVDVFDGSQVSLAFVRLTAATSGVGLLNEGEAIVTYSLIDGNPGGGIRNVGGGGPAILTLGDSTIAGNTGAGINSIGNSANDVDILYSTIARNTGAGLAFDSQQLANVEASIIANNSVSCSGGTVDGTSNVESTTSCALDAGTNRVVSDPLLAAGLSNQGGFTDVLTIPANSPAADYVSPCFLLIDQRAFNRPANQPCDAGAYDRDAVDPGFVVDPQPTPTPTPAPPQPTPTPAPPAEPTPVPNRSVVGDEERGTVKVKLPGTSRFVDLNDVTSLPNNTEIDARKGAIKIKAVPKAGAPAEEATFSEGLFKLNQRGGVTTLTLSEVLDCPKGKKASLAAKKAKKRKLWGDGKGAFRTQGKYSAATVRGTKWLVEDTCTTTTVRVTQGVVRATGQGKSYTVRAGQKRVFRARK
ncbi:right-handed parallel beta-helix repeat-containing protein [Solirubrobacter phytolaccae]|uniref:Right-handed parallel beta-helix repeat-containing protein n=1 Tax=Solirubrobacter phytolaccae TaxID=1404360 RepID=A0A9X3S9T4_9ACTN|nr:right-handed parallel beta-helix repeat-containing protein [Solirubrobacter phytolaccae]MDA0181836.1 right-handed parallel beta-helix repeat-containing protein [Solirubrobacter phytolaccae]